MARITADATAREEAIIATLTARPLTQLELRHLVKQQPDYWRLFVDGRYPTATKMLVYSTSERLVKQGRLRRSDGREGNLYWVAEPS